MDDQEIEQEYVKFLARTGRNGMATKEEFESRKKIFGKNMMKINKRNKQNLDGVVLAINNFADFTQDEYKSKLGFKTFTKATSTPALRDTASLPDSVDWVAAGKIQPPKDQGQCGSCWAFSAVAALEGRAAIASGTLQSFSE
jgi:C1A family cysteine protease